MFLVPTITNHTQEHQATGSFHTKSPSGPVLFLSPIASAGKYFLNYETLRSRFFFSYFKLLHFVAAGVLPWAGCGSETADIPVSGAGQLVFLTPAGSTSHDDGRQLLVILQPVLLTHKGSAKLGKFLKSLQLGGLSKASRNLLTGAAVGRLGWAPRPCQAGSKGGARPWLCHGC